MAIVASLKHECYFDILISSNKINFDFFEMLVTPIIRFKISSAGADYVSASQDFVFDPSMTTTQVCMSILTLEDELVEDTETISIAATGISGLSLSGSPATLEIHSRECEPTLPVCKGFFLYRGYQGIETKLL